MKTKYYKTKKYKKLGIEVTETLHHGKTYEECVKLMPEGWRLLKPSEAMAIWEKEKFEDWFFIEQIIKEYKGGAVAWFVADGDWADLYCGWNPDNVDDALGVKYCRDLNVIK